MDPILSYLPSIWDKYYYYARFTYEKNEAQISYLSKVIQQINDDSHPGILNDKISRKKEIIILNF